MMRNHAVHAHAKAEPQHAFGVMTCAICPSCAREHRDDARTCTACGTPLTLAVCAACEAINAIDAASCHQCGARLDREPWSVDAAPASETDDVREAPADITFVFDTVHTTVPAPDSSDDVIALGEKRYVGPDARQHALAEATPIAFAERAMHVSALPEATLTGPGARNPRTPRLPARRAHLGVAFAVVVVAGAVGYWAFDVPALRGVVANALGGPHAVAPFASLVRTQPGVEHANDGHVRLPPASNPVSSAADAVDASARNAPPTATATQTPAIEEAVPDNDSSSEAKAGSGAREVQADRSAATKPRTGSAEQRRSARAHARARAASPPRPADRAAVATQRLIERDLGRFLAK